MKIAVTGAGGFIGTQLLKELAGREDAQVIALSRNAKEGFTATDYSVESLTELFNGVDAVVHLASRRGAAEAYMDFKENDQVTENILKAMVNCGVKKMIFMSSLSVYSDLQQLPWKEDQHPVPQTFYALSKLSGEGLCQLYSRKGIRFTIFRCGIVMGLENSGRMLAVFIRKAMSHETISLRGKSVAKRDFVYVKDVVRALLWDLFSNKQTNQIYNLGSRSSYTNLEAAQMINSCFENEGNLIYDDTVCETVTDSYMDSEKLAAAGCPPVYTFETALQDIRREWKNGEADSGAMEEQRRNNSWQV